MIGGLDRLYGQGCDQLAVDCEEDGYYCLTYSDGSPVYSSSSPAEQFSSPKPYCGDFGLEDALEPCTEVIVHWPPHLRSRSIVPLPWTSEANCDVQRKLPRSADFSGESKKPIP